MLKKKTASFVGHWVHTVSHPSGSGPRHCRLTDSPARTNVALFLHRAVRLIFFASRTSLRPYCGTRCLGTSGLGG